MNHQTRIGLTDTGMDILTKMSEGNPGALRVLMDTMASGPSIDPSSALGPLSVALSLDTHGIYGSAIWILYKDVCRQDLVSMIGLLRAVQLGLMPESELIAAVAGKRLDAGIIATYVEQVKTRLPAFGCSTSAVPA